MLIITLLTGVVVLLIAGGVSREGVQKKDRAVILAGVILFFIGLYFIIASIGLATMGLE